ncbi:MAG: hypothetical protein NVS3B21_02460 [Acidimicrobiales bacterium]
MALELRAGADLPCSLVVAQAELEVLDHYPAWLGIVFGVDAADGDPDDPGPAWWVELGGRVGVVHKTKRVRMVRATCEVGSIRFERCELDLRRHNEWVLGIALASTGPTGTRLEMAVRYGGDRRVPVLDAVLRAEVRRAGRRLAARVAEVGSSD